MNRGLLAGSKGHVTSHPCSVFVETIAGAITSNRRTTVWTAFMAAARLGHARSVIAKSFTYLYSSCSVTRHSFLPLLILGLMPRDGLWIPMVRLPMRKWCRPVSLVPHSSHLYSDHGH